MKSTLQLYANCVWNRRCLAGAGATQSDHSEAHTDSGVCLPRPVVARCGGRHLVVPKRQYHCRRLPCLFGGVPMVSRRALRRIEQFEQRIGPRGLERPDVARRPELTGLLFRVAAAGAGRGWALRGSAARRGGRHATHGCRSARGRSSARLAGDVEIAGRNLSDPVRAGLVRRGVGVEDDARYRIVGVDYFIDHEAEEFGEYVQREGTGLTLRETLVRQVREAGRIGSAA